MHRRHRSPSAPSADPAIADKAEKQQAGGKRARSRAGVGGLIGNLPVRGIYHGILITEPARRGKRNAAAF